MPEKLLQMPTDDELVRYFMDAANDGAHDNIKGHIKNLTGYMEKAKAEIKKILIFTPEKGIQLNLTIATGNQALEGMINAQNFMVKWILKGLLSVLADGSFGGFVKKMKMRTDDSVPVTIDTTTRIFTFFLEKIGTKYVVWTSPDEVRLMVQNLFA